ncbi:unnamed protein product [Tuber aestivum]|uniref:Peptidyl-tRNA hydrolase n=1 Tax=Tuber aestivum TaxID=59557 RepID=A0A292PW31_9PEZI|nr:unnamed protein product [Tuber aestivum]
MNKYTFIPILLASANPSRTSLFTITRCCRSGTHSTAHSGIRAFTTAQGLMAQQRRILVCSIGNPGKYLNTRHSAGHTLSNLLQETLAFPPFRKNTSYGGDVSVGRFDSTYTLFQSPSLMNISGGSVKKAWKAFMAELSNEEKGNALLVVLHDELEAALGRVKVKKGGSAKGHNGIVSCAESLGSKVGAVLPLTTLEGGKGGRGEGEEANDETHSQQDFCRIGIGIGRPDSRDRDTVSEYVLGKMTSYEKDTLKMESLPEVLAALEKLSAV